MLVGLPRSSSLDADRTTIAPSAVSSVGGAGPPGTCERAVEGSVEPAGPPPPQTLLRCFGQWAPRTDRASLPQLSHVFKKLIPVDRIHAFDVIVSSYKRYNHGVTCFQSLGMLLSYSEYRCRMAVYRRTPGIGF